MLRVFVLRALLVTSMALSTPLVSFAQPAVPDSARRPELWGTVGVGASRFYQVTGYAFGLGVAREVLGRNFTGARLMAASELKWADCGPFGCSNEPSIILEGAVLVGRQFGQGQSRYGVGAGPGVTHAETRSYLTMGTRPGLALHAGAYRWLEGRRRGIGVALAINLGRGRTMGAVMVSGTLGRMNVR